MKQSHKVGLSGVSGIEMAQDPAGPRGVQGLKAGGLFGPSGRVGQTGAPATSGEAGARSTVMASVAGASGDSGPAGRPIPASLIAPRESAGRVERWISYGVFCFDYNRAVLNPEHGPKLFEIANYMRLNPSLSIGIDDAIDPNGCEPSGQDLSDRRVIAVHEGLVKTGVPPERIEIGSFGDAQFRKAGRVEVLLISTEILLGIRAPNGLGWLNGLIVELTEQISNLRVPNATSTHGQDRRPD